MSKYGIRSYVTDEDSNTDEIDALIRKKRKLMNELSRILGAYLLENGGEMEVSLSNIAFLEDNEDYLLDLRNNNERGTITLSLHKREDYYSA